MAFCFNPAALPARSSPFDRSPPRLDPRRRTDPPRRLRHPVCTSSPAATASSSHTQWPNYSRAPSGLIVGLTQYSHDASVAVVDAATGALLFAASKERISRRKHDGGGVASLVRYALRSLGFVRADVRLVVANNHHFRIRDYEQRLPFSVAARYCPPEEVSPWNLLGQGEGRKIELSHHQAHAYSAITNAPFDEALVVVMDGMGDARDDWLRAEAVGGDRLYSDTMLAKHPAFQEYPSLAPGVSYREAETVYHAVRDDHGHITLTRVFKRWTPEVSPPELYNHGFHDMESVGAVYSRVATVIFGDWNTCGKVMGLAPYGIAGRREMEVDQLMSGRLYDGSFKVHAEVLSSLPHVNDWNNPAVRPFYEALAARVQYDLETTTLAFLDDLRQATGASNLIFAGGVALNSTLNGRIVREAGFDDVYVPFMPGDEGIAIGCALYGHSRLSDVERGLRPVSGGDMPSKEHGVDALPASKPPLFRPYLSAAFDAEIIKEACLGFSSWTSFDVLEDMDGIIGATVSALDAGEVVAMFNGRSEFGPRALGNRSLLADPRRESMVDHLNEVVKKRESFRPFAPACLAEHVKDMFGGPCRSPYMTMTMPLTNREQVPAVSHVDGTARLQTISADVNPIFHQLVSAFHKVSGIPAVLNTSFNIAGEPIVESPWDAIRTLLNGDGIGLLVFPDAKTVLRARACPASWSRPMCERSVCVACESFRSEVIRDSSGNPLRVSVLYDEFREDSTKETECAEEGDMDMVALEPTSRSVELESADELDLLEYIAGIDGSLTVADLVEVAEHGEEDCFDEAGADTDHIGNICELVLRLWSKRLVTVS